MSRGWRVAAAVAIGIELGFAAVATPFTPRADAVTSVAIATMVGVVVAQRTLRPVPRALARRPPDGDGAPLRLSGWLPWAAVLAVITAWELLALSGAPRPDHPTLSYLADWITADDGGRCAWFAGWLAAGWYLVTR